MKAVLTQKIRSAASIYPKHNLQETRYELLKFVRGGKVTWERQGLCSNFNVGPICYAITGESFPIKDKPWTTGANTYYPTNILYTPSLKYVGNQLKQRRKLAVKLINVIDQYLLETRK